MEDSLLGLTLGNASITKKIEENLNSIPESVNRCAFKNATLRNISSNYLNSIGKYKNGYKLSNIGDAAMYADKENQLIHLNLETLSRIYKVENELKHIVIQLYAIHETLHISQGVGNYLEVKNLQKTKTKWIISYLDLTSTWMSSHLYNWITNSKSKDWDEIESSSQIFDALLFSMKNFGSNKNSNKLKRYLGKLLSICLYQKYPNSRFCWNDYKIVWPEWSDDYTYLSLFTNDLNLLAPAQKVSTNIQDILNDINQGNVNDAYKSSVGLLEEFELGELI